MKTKNLKFRTDLWDRVSYGWAVTHQMIIFSSRLLKRIKYLNLSIYHRSLRDFQPLHFICHSFVWNFVYNWFSMMPEIIFKLLRVALWGGCAVWLESEQTPSFLIGHQLRSAAQLLCTEINLEHTYFLLSLIFTHRPINEIKIQQRNKLCFCSVPVLTKSIKIPFPIKKPVLSDLLQPQIYRTLKPLWLSN